MLAPTGNMRAVYLECAKQAEDDTNRIVQAAKPDSAEIVPNQDATWHVVVPRDSNLAYKHLIRRRFGIYHPMLTKRISRRGREVPIREQLFPGYIFIFMFGFKSQWRRVFHCPGVERLIMLGELPAIMPDQLIGELQWKESVSDANADKPRRMRGKWAKWMNAAGPWKPTISTKSYWDGVERLDSPERISLLHRALSLPS